MERGLWRSGLEFDAFTFGNTLTVHLHQQLLTADDNVLVVNEYSIGDTVRADIADAQLCFHL